PYRLEFRSRTTTVERPNLMEGEALGQLTGGGRWRLWENPAGVCVTYEWRVETSEAWLNLLSPIARPASAWNTDSVLRRGGEGQPVRLLVGRLATRLAGPTCLRLVDEFRPDAVVSTYPGITEVGAQLRRAGRVRVPLCSAITDLSALWFWAAPGVDLHLITH